MRLGPAGAEQPAVLDTAADGRERYLGLDGIADDFDGAFFAPAARCGSSAPSTSTASVRYSRSSSST
jgi:hypothetical protein